MADVQDFSPAPPNYAKHTDYTLIDRLGSGGFGQIWRAKDNNTSTEIAIKYILANDDMDGYSKTTLTEIAIPLSVNHPNIVKYTTIIDPFPIPGGSELINEDFKVETEIIGVVMFKADGDMKALTRSDMPTVQKYFIGMAYQMVDAIAYLTSRNIIHRDIKPQNMLYNRCPDTDEYKLCLIDFGVATENECYMDRKTPNVYTIWYRPPELMVEGDNLIYDAETDVWALGCTLYEIYTGNPLFPQDNEIEMLNDIFSKLGRESDPQSTMYDIWKSNYSERINISDIHNPLLDIKSVNELLYSLLKAMLQIDPKERMTIFDVQSHPFFQTLHKSSCYPIVRSERIECLARASLNYRDLNFSLLIENTDQTSRNSNHIKTLLKWMLRVLNELSVKQRNSYFVAIQLLLRYIIIENVPLNQLQLSGGTALSLADKYTLWVRRYVSSYSHATEERKAQDLIDFQRKMMKTLNFDMVASTPFDIIQGYYHISIHPNAILLAGDILAHVSLTDYYFQKISDRYVYRPNLPVNCLILASIGGTNQIPLIFKIVDFNAMDEIIKVVNPTIVRDSKSYYYIRRNEMGLNDNKWDRLVKRYNDFVTQYQNNH
jgi:serine/threonine protein kinase